MIPTNLYNNYDKFTDFDWLVFEHMMVGVVDDNPRFHRDNIVRYNIQIDGTYTISYVVYKDNGEIMSSLGYIGKVLQEKDKTKINEC